MSCVDKENDFNFGNRIIGDNIGSNAGPKKSRFGSMLAEARKEVQEEQDNLLAVDCQANEVAGMVREWVQENQDMHLAVELSKSLEEEEKANRRLEVLRGESEALKIAVEEKRRLKNEAEEKIKREKYDAEFARNFIENEEKEYQRQRASMLYADEKLCRQLSEDVDEKKDEKGVVSREYHTAEYKSGAVDDDCECKEWSSDEEDDGAEEEKADFDDAGHAERIVQQLEHDFELARHFQRQFDLEAKRAKSQLEAKDEQYSRKIQAMEERKSFMARKRAQLRGDYEQHVDKYKEAFIASLWESAEADVDNVQNALCLSLLLPNVTQVQVKLLFEQQEDNGRFNSRRFSLMHKKNPVIRIEAQRLVDEKYAGRNDASQQYIAEFQLDPNAGRSRSSSFNLLGGISKDSKRPVGLKLSHKDIYYEYVSDSGLLHVFVENILLDEDVYNKEFPSASSSSSSAAPSAPVNTANTVGGSVKTMMMKQFQTGFLRIFGQGKIANASNNHLDDAALSNKNRK